MIKWWKNEVWDAPKCWGEFAWCCERKRACRRHGNAVGSNGWGKKEMPRVAAKKITLMLPSQKIFMLSLKNRKSFHNMKNFFVWKSQHTEMFSTWDFLSQCWYEDKFRPPGFVWVDFKNDSPEIFRNMKMLTFCKKYRYVMINRARVGNFENLKYLVHRC